MANSMYVVGLTTLLAIYASTETGQKSYCGLKRCHQRNHTLCKYPLLQTSDKCGEVTSANLTADEVEELVKIHNTNRSKPLTWDKELADIAQTWADQCELGQDDCRNVERFYVAQTYAYTKNTGGFVSKLPDMVNMNQMTEKTTHVGCGAVRYNADAKWNTTYLVCNYGSLPTEPTTTTNKSV